MWGALQAGAAGSSWASFPPALASPFCAANGTRYNLLNSACLELFEFIRRVGGWLQHIGAAGCTAAGCTAAVLVLLTADSFAPAVHTCSSVAAAGELEGAAGRHCGAALGAAAGALGQGGWQWPAEPRVACRQWSRHCRLTSTLAFWLLPSACGLQGVDSCEVFQGMRIRHEQNQVGWLWEEGTLLAHVPGCPALRSRFLAQEAATLPLDLLTPNTTGPHRAWRRTGRGAARGRPRGSRGRHAGATALGSCGRAAAAT